MKRVFAAVVMMGAMMTTEVFAGNGDLIVDGNMIFGGLFTADGQYGGIHFGQMTNASSGWDWGDITLFRNGPDSAELRIEIGDNANDTIYIGGSKKPPVNGTPQFFGTPGGMTVTGAGNVGIGTTTPETKLNVLGELKLGKTTSGGIPWLSMSSNMTNSGSSKGLTTHNIFGPYDAVSGGIGTLYIGVGASADNSRNDLVMYNHGCSLGTCNMKSAYINADTTYVSGSIFQSSDSRLKKDIAETANSLEKLKQIKVVTYKWKEKGMGEDPQIGVIAQDVEAVFPELVKEVTNQLYLHSENKEGLLPLIKSVDYGKLAAIALQGVKELSTKVDRLEERLQKLEYLLKDSKVN